MHCPDRAKLADSTGMSEPEDSERLYRKRSVLQARLRRQERDRQVRALAPRLRAAGVRKLSRLPPTRLGALLAPFKDLPGRDERFHWPDIQGGNCVDWQSDEARDEAFRDALSACFAPSARLVLVFHTSDYAWVMGREDAAAQARLLLDACVEALWVVALKPDGHLLEVAPGENEVCWGADLLARD